MAKRILILAGDFAEDYELMVPFQALKMLGCAVDVVCPDRDEGDKIITAIHDFEEGDEQTYSEKKGHYFTLNADFLDVDVADYDGLIIPGGRSPEYIRLYDDVIDIVKQFDDADKPIAAMCHGPLVLAAAGILEGRKCAGYKTIGPDITNAGGEYMDVDLDEAYLDGNLVTAPSWNAHPDFLATFIELLEIKIES